MKIEPQHSSAVNQNIKPKNMDVMKIAPESRRFIEAEALSVFAAMTNAGASLQQTLLAVYLSGMSAAHSARTQ